MTDNYIVEKYLNGFFDIYLNEDLLIVDIDSRTVEKFYLLEHLNKVFPCIKSKIIESTFNDWYIKKIEHFSSNFLNFLSECDVVLGPRYWIVIHKKFGQIESSNIHGYSYGDEISKHKDAMNRLFDEWYSNEIINVSEKTWNNWIQ